MKCLKWKPMEVKLNHCCIYIICIVNTWIKRFLCIFRIVYAMKKLKRFHRVTFFSTIYRMKIDLEMQCIAQIRICTLYIFIQNEKKWERLNHLNMLCMRIFRLSQKALVLNYALALLVKCYLHYIYSKLSYIPELY